MTEAERVAYWMLYKTLMGYSQGVDLLADPGRVVIDQGVRRRIQVAANDLFKIALDCKTKVTELDHVVKTD